MSKIGQESPFLPYLQNATSNVDETWPKVGKYGLSLYDIGMYAGKTGDNPLNPLENNGLRKLNIFELRYE